MITLTAESQAVTAFFDAWLRQDWRGMFDATSTKWRTWGGASDYTEMRRKFGLKRLRRYEIIEERPNLTGYIDVPYSGRAHRVPMTFTDVLVSVEYTIDKRKLARRILVKMLHEDERGVSVPRDGIGRWSVQPLSVTRETA